MLKGGHPDLIKAKLGSFGVYGCTLLVLPPWDVPCLHYVPKDMK